MDFENFPYKLTWKVETKQKTKTKKPKKIYDSHSAWFLYDDDREKHILRLKGEGAKFIRKTTKRAT